MDTGAPDDGERCWDLHAPGGRVDERGANYANAWLDIDLGLPSKNSYGISMIFYAFRGRVLKPLKTSFLIAFFLMF